MPNTNKRFEFFTDLNKSRDVVDFSKPIMVSCESLAPFTEKNIVSDDGMTWYIDLMYFDTWSRNQNLYPREDTIRSFKESYWIQENLRNRTLYGELEHPPADATLERFMFIEPTRYAWNIGSIEDKGDRYSGFVTLCAPLGTSIVLPNMKALGCNYAASCRISTPNFVVKEMNGRKAYIKKYKFFPISYDLVTCPGIPQCRLIKDGEYVPEPISIKGNSSGAHGLVATESSPVFSSIFSDPASTIKEMLKSEESGRIVSDIFGIDYDKTSVILTKDKKVKISMESGVSATIPINSYLLSDVLRNNK